MNYRMTFYSLGYVMRAEAVLMLLSLCVAFYYGEQTAAASFVATIFLILCFALPISWKKPENRTIFAKEGLVIVALSWLAMSFFGCLPFIFSGSIPGFVDSFFESVSGFTTTGSTILTDIEVLPKSILFWRSFTHWIGGMGVLVFVLAISSLSGGNSLHLIRAESTGPDPGKLVPKIRQTAKILYLIYIAMTILEVILLLFGGLSLYDSLIHAMGTAGTGGFSNYNSSAANFSPYVQTVIGIFMVLFSFNFNFFYLLLIRKFAQVRKFEEVWVFVGIVLFATITISLDLFNTVYQNFGESLLASFFQVSSIISTTGFASTDFNLWPQYSRTLLVIVMVIGACGGSTGGGVKVARVILLFKNLCREIQRFVHPRSVRVITLSGKKVEEDTLRGIHFFLGLYVVVVVVSVLLLSLEGYSLETNLTAVLATINNIGPGLDLVGPVANFGFFNPFSKLVLIFNMLAGRLEIIPIIALFSPSIWRGGRSNDKKRVSV